MGRSDQCHVLQESTWLFWSTVRSGLTRRAHLWACTRAQVTRNQKNKQLCSTLLSGMQQQRCLVRGTRDGSVASIPSSTFKPISRRSSPYEIAKEHESIPMAHRSGREHSTTRRPLGMGGTRRPQATSVIFFQQPLALASVWSSYKPQ